MLDRTCKYFKSHYRPVTVHYKIRNIAEHSRRPQIEGSEREEAAPTKTDGDASGSAAVPVAMGVDAVGPALILFSGMGLPVAPGRVLVSSAGPPVVPCMVLMSGAGSSVGLSGGTSVKPLVGTGCREVVIVADDV